MREQAMVDTPQYRRIRVRLRANPCRCDAPACTWSRTPGSSDETVVARRRPRIQQHVFRAEQCSRASTVKRELLQQLHARHILEVQPGQFELCVEIQNPSKLHDSVATSGDLRPWGSGT